MTDTKQDSDYELIEAKVSRKIDAQVVDKLNQLYQLAHQLKWC